MGYKHLYTGNIWITSFLCYGIWWPLFLYLHQQFTVPIVIFVYWTQLLEYWTHDTDYMLWIYIIFRVFLSLWGFSLHHSILDLSCLNFVHPGCWRWQFNHLSRTNQNIWITSFYSGIQILDNCPVFKWHLNTWQNCQVFSSLYEKQTIFICF